MNRDRIVGRDSFGVEVSYRELRDCIDGIMSYVPDIERCVSDGELEAASDKFLFALLENQYIAYEKPIARHLHMGGLGFVDSVKMLREGFEGNDERKVQAGLKFIKPFGAQTRLPNAKDLE